MLTKIISQTASPPFNLPTEFFDKIMDHVFIFPSPIEFSSIEETRRSRISLSLGRSQY